MSAFEWITHQCAGKHKHPRSVTQKQAPGPGVLGSAQHPLPVSSLGEEAEGGRRRKGLRSGSREGDPWGCREGKHRVETRFFTNTPHRGLTPTCCQLYIFSIKKKKKKLIFKKSVANSFQAVRRQRPNPWSLKGKRTKFNRVKCKGLTGFIP